MSEPLAKTKQRLISALENLMATKSFQKISVNDLCLESQIGRSTFYDHFEDKYQLLEYMLAYHRQQLIQEVQDEPIEQKLTTFLQVIQNQQQVLKHLLFSKLDWEAIQLVRNMWREVMHETVVSKIAMDTGLKVNEAIVADFFGGGFAAVIVKWVATDFPQSPHQLASELLNLLLIPVNH